MMDILTDFSSRTWSQPLVWTLLHSIWQAAIVLMVLIAGLRIVPSRYSSTRYRMSIAALALILLSSAGTYCLLINETIAGPRSPNELFVTGTYQSVERAVEAHITPFSQLQYFVESNIFLITLLWMTGAFLFSLRIASGFLYINSVRRNARLLNEEWNDLLRTLASQVNLNRIVTIAESSSIKVPFVVGYFKPLILIPTGMISGLSTEQLEAILVHELMHIRRNDYLVNIVQSIVEAVFYFNPFVWMVSSIIRSEREHCCDDEVVKHSSAMAYAHALTQLEEIKLANSNLALSLAGNKNQLLKRIKRIMEKSVQNYSVKERLVPVLLLVVGLACASWLTIKSPVSNQHTEAQKSVAEDTTKLKGKSARHARKKVTSSDENGIPQEQVVEAFEGDVEPRPWVEYEAHEPFELAPLTELAEIAALPAFPPLAPMPPDMVLMLDTPELFFGPGHDPDWAAFSEEFKLKFKDRFGDFYKQHGEEMEKMMLEINRDLKSKFANNWAAMADMSLQQHQELVQQQMEVQQEAMAHQKEAMEEVQLHMQKLQQEQEVHFKELEREMKGFEEKMKAFEKELKEELIKDGYLGKDEKINNINVDEDGVIEVNGIKIKESDQKKYHDIHRKYFKQGGKFRYSE